MFRDHVIGASLGLLLLGWLPGAAVGQCAIDKFPALPDVRILSVAEETLPAPHCKVVGVIGAEIGFELPLVGSAQGR